MGRSASSGLRAGLVFCFFSMSGSVGAVPTVSLPPTPDLPGITTVAASPRPGDPNGFELGGFRLGMTADAAMSTAKAHGLKVTGQQMVVDFESRVRSAINIRTGSGLPETHHPVLDQVSFADANDGRWQLRFLGWPDGAHLYDITYLVPRGTSAAEWRRLLTERFGPADDITTGGTDFVARWCGHTSPACGLPKGSTARVAVGPDGGSVELVAPEGTAQRVGDLVKQAVDAFVPTHRPAF